MLITDMQHVICIRYKVMILNDIMLVCTREDYQ